MAVFLRKNTYPIEADLCMYQGGVYIKWLSVLHGSRRVAELQDILACLLPIKWNV